MAVATVTATRANVCSSRYRYPALQLVQKVHLPLLLSRLHWVVLTVPRSAALTVLGTVAPPVASLGAHRAGRCHSDSPSPPKTPVLKAAR